RLLAFLESRGMAPVPEFAEL
ncbi:phosphotransferase, partial [Salmonella enterica subsp. enterica serovar Mbandaka]|nr:phosphotransferase [Salmonella enterica subsp. enterica serovar Mbandaka]